MLQLATNPSGADPYDQAKHLTSSPPAYFLNGMLNNWAGAVCANETSTTGLIADVLNSYTVHRPGRMPLIQIYAY